MPCESRLATRPMVQDRPTIQAAYFGPQGFEIRRLPRPVPDTGEVLIEVDGCGICGSDLHVYEGSAAASPVCPGHEIAGRVAPDSPLLPPGLEVVVEPLVACGVCRSCQAGEPNLCPSLVLLGTRRAGGFADVVAVPLSSVYPLPPGLDLAVAVLAEPLAVAVHAVGLADLEPGAEVLVIGGGTIGLLTAFMAARVGASVTISVRHPHQGAAALRLGAHDVVDADPHAVIARVAPRPPDVVFETVGGRAATLPLALAAVRPGGTIVTLGVFSTPIVLDPIAFLTKEVRVMASMMYSRKAPDADFTIALRVLRDERSRLATLVTHDVPLSEIDRAFALASDKHSGAIKVAVHPTPSS